MATEWYLMTTPHDQVSGYESEALDDFAEEGFAEILDSDLAEDVVLCNYDLSECQSIRTVVQNNVANTQLQSITRQFLLPIGTCKAGMYIKYKDRYWLITGFVDNNKMYEKAVAILCNYLLSWLNKENKPVQRWISATSASQYNNGETSSKYYYLRSDQLLIFMPDDDESLMINSMNRFIIDKRCKLYEQGFTDDVTIDVSKDVITYRLTRSDSVLYDYQDSGVYQFMVTQDEQHTDDGYYVIDGKGYWLCGKATSPLPTTSSEPLTSKIISESDEIYNQLEPTAFLAKFYGENGEEVNISPQWNIICDFEDELTIGEDGQFICISSNNNKLINKKFVLSLSAENYETVTKTITIRAFV